LLRNALGAGLKRDTVLKALADCAASARHRRNPKPNFSARQIRRDLTALARQGKIDPVIGRDEKSAA